MLTTLAMRVESWSVFMFLVNVEQGNITIATDGCAVYLITYVQSLIFQTVTVSTWKGIF